MNSNAISLSAEMEDYLEAIASLFRNHGTARVTDIAKRLVVSKSSVTLALRTLADKGLVHYQPYMTPTLTENGRKIAERVQHRHDILKQFLVNILGVDAALAEKNACRMEHVVDRVVLDHVLHFMDFIQKCPRGGSKWIHGYEYLCDPDKDTAKCEQCMSMALQEYRQQQSRRIDTEVQMSLAELKPGSTGHIAHIGRAGSARRRLADMGVVNGARVTMIKVAPLGDPLEVKIKGYCLTLRKADAENISITFADSQSTNPATSKQD